MPDRTEGSPPANPGTRRKFLRQAGFTAATAAIVGLTDIVGSKAASAAAKSPAPTVKPAPRSLNVKMTTLSPDTAKRIQEIRASATPDTTICCVTDPGHCGGPCHPSNVWCHVCCDPYGHCFYACANGNGSFCY